VAECLDLSKAAEELNLSQPAVTSQIKALDEALGISLFDRIGRNAALTPSGRTLLSVCAADRSSDQRSSVCPRDLRCSGGHRGLHWCLSYERSLPSSSSAPPTCIGLAETADPRLERKPIATPVIRVAFCVLGFTRQGDRLYVCTSGTVLLILFYSLVQGGL